MSNNNEKVVAKKLEYALVTMASAEVAVMDDNSYSPFPFHVRTKLLTVRSPSNNDVSLKEPGGNVPTLKEDEVIVDSIFLSWDPKVLSLPPRK